MLALWLTTVVVPPRVAHSALLDKASRKADESNQSQSKSQ